MKTRVQIEFDEKSFEGLKNLQEMCENSTYAHVIKNALRVYEFFLIEEQKGSSFFFKEKGEKDLTKIKFFL